MISVADSERANDNTPARVIARGRRRRRHGVCVVPRGALTQRNVDRLVVVCVPDIKDHQRRSSSRRRLWR